MKAHAIITAAILALTLGTGAPAVMAAQDSELAPAAAAPAAPMLQATLQNLWHGHIVATRDYALALHMGSDAGAENAEDAAVDNARQIAAAVASVYGDEAGAGTLKLLGGHWSGVKALTQAARAGDDAAEDKAMQDLAANAMEIARFFAGANPDNWTVDGLNQALLMHAGGHKLQVDLMMADAPAEEQQTAWTQMQEHMDMIANALADGIAAQFPDKVN